ncbi:uncharacterized protein N7479_009612 [Penicillium vulpinum]|uniref:Uncharacterized protein n=1 Tax=Penicillium vulpinum TaxID=29845 RepID=A0A1V6RZ46_9EURO|nr:uncharacterized protein N7479_009612 [Penicillium vulpinum]KAJ5951199.1 hypothetical protein N7479_009612 [Penicillium vulpinum]OQE06888.1 hypothetical protein PENVUL_c016G02301 [Penicillium vulpinum]
MASKDRKYRLWYVPVDMSIPQKPQRRYYDKFGGYNVNDWYCKHEYHCYPGAESYHYINLNGWYYSMNPDGSEEKLHMKRKEAWFGPPDNDDWENWPNVVPWDKLPAIPDRCIDKFSRPGPWIWKEIERLEREQGGYQGAMITQECDHSDWEERSEGRVPSADEAVEPKSTSDTSVKSEDDTSEGRSSTGEMSRDEMSESNVPRKKRSTASKVSTQHTLPMSLKEQSDESESDAIDDSHTEKIGCKNGRQSLIAIDARLTAESNTFEEPEEQKEQKRLESKQAEKQESQEDPEERKPKTKKTKKQKKKQRILGGKLKEDHENPVDVPNRKRKASDEDEVGTPPITVKKKKHHRSQESGVATGGET